METNIRSMLDRLTVHWSNICSMEIIVDRTDEKVVVVHVQTINMESRCVWCCWTDWLQGTSELSWSTLWRNHEELGHIMSHRDKHQVLQGPCWTFGWVYPPSSSHETELYNRWFWARDMIGQLSLTEHVQKRSVNFESVLLPHQTWMFIFGKNKHSGF